MENARNTKLKVDFNLLQSGTWVLEKKGNQRIHYFEKEVGDGKIVIYNALDVPSPLDSKVLDFLILTSQEKDWAKEVEIVSLRRMAKEVGLGTDKRKLDRLKFSFKILANTRIEFHNCFIDNGVLAYFEGEYDVVDIGIISDFSFKRTKIRGNPISVQVVFNDNFIALCKHSLGYKLIPYAPISGLRDTAYALYKWAWRWFDSSKGYGERWIGNGKSLVKWYKNELNSIANYKYPSEVLRRLKSAIKQLNENPEVPFYLELKEEKGNYKIEIHRKDQCTLKREIPFDKLPKLLRDALISVIKRKKYIRDPYALARSMSWKEIENNLKDLVVAEIPKDAWETIEQIRPKIQNEKERMELEALAVSNKGNRTLIVIPKKRLKSSLAEWLDGFYPNWREFIRNAIGYIEEAKMEEVSKR